MFVVALRSGCANALAYVALATIAVITIAFLRSVDFTRPKADFA